MQTLYCAIIAIVALVVIFYLFYAGVVLLARAEEPKTVGVEAVVPQRITYSAAEQKPAETEQLTAKAADTQQPDPYYPLTADERTMLEQLVEAEAGGEDYIGKILVAQCIINACHKTNLRPAEAAEQYRYTSRRPYQSAEAVDAVRLVFDLGYVIEAEPIMYFYAPALCSSAWHESQPFVLEHGCHRFFKEAD